MRSHHLNPSNWSKPEINCCNLGTKHRSDSIEFYAVSKNNDINEEQFKRYEDLLTKGIISETEYETRKAKLQESQSKKISAENKWINE
jgi:hypothetical protein